MINHIPDQEPKKSYLDMERSTQDKMDNTAKRFDILPI